MKKFFTLIEVIVVLGVLGFIIPTIFIIVFTISREQLKINSITEIKRQGDFIVNNISNLIKNNAISIHNSIPPNQSNIVCYNANYSSDLELYFKDQNDNWFRIFYNNNKISSSSAITTIDLNSNSTKIYNFSIGCQSGSFYSAPIVNLSFDICYKGNQTDCININESTASLHYQTKIKLRNYYIDY